LKGLNTRSPINQLGPDEAYELTNFIPDAGYLRLREGSTLVTVGVPSTEIGKLMTWSYQGADRLLWSFGYTGGYILMTTDGLTTDPRILNGTDWACAMMNGLLGMVNGQDQPTIFDGTDFFLMTTTGPANPSTLSGIKIFKSRSYFWANGELGFWYSAVNALGGTLTRFPLETVSQKGGAVMSINAWSRDSGSGPDDFLVITTTKGEVLVYQGSNPSDPNDWAIVGRFQIGVPIDRNAFLELDGRIFVLTQTDLEMIPDNFVRQQPLSRLSGAIRANYQDYGSTGRYTLFYDQVRDRILLNIPMGQGRFDQLVKTTFGYTRFTGINAVHYVMYNNEVHFVTPTALFKWGGAKDRLGAETVADITFSAKTGYGMLGGNSEKRVSMYRPNMKSSGSVTLTTALDFDHKGRYLPVQTTGQNQSTAWGSPWGSPWSNSTSDRGDWLVGCGTGQTISLSLSGSCPISLEWMGTDYELVPGGLY